jgi:hypothetical protein
LSPKFSPPVAASIFERIVSRRRAWYSKRVLQTELGERTDELQRRLTLPRHGCASGCGSGFTGLAAGRVNAQSEFRQDQFANPLKAWFVFGEHLKHRDGRTAWTAT